MNISNREKIMLSILGIIIIGIGYYKFVYSFQINEIQMKTKQESEIEQKYDTVMNTIKSIDSKKSDVKILKAKISNEAKSFYPTISEEHIIVELDKLLTSNELEGRIIFNPIVSDSVEVVDENNETLAESSLQGMVDKYNNEEESNAENDTDEESKQNTNVTSNSSSNNDEKSRANNKNNSDSKKKNTVHYMKCEVDFEGSYEGLNKLLNEIGKNEKKIVVNSVTLSENTINSVKGTINLEIYSIPKIDNDLEEYLKWDFNNTYGKNVPFETGAASGFVEESKDVNDFMISVKSVTSELPTIMVGKANDSLGTTYVYADSNTEEYVEMILNQEGDKYYYKYKTSKGTYPANYDGLGEEFIPVSKNIVLDVLSENRATTSDNSEMKLKIINNTDRLADVNISGDDINNPRVVIDGDGNKISVNKK
jgi:hypothetical protein